MSALPKPETHASQRWVTFQLGGERYAVDVMRVQEVLKPGEIAPVPGAPAHVLGIINLRGNVVTVIDGRTRLALDASSTGDTARIIIIEVGRHVAGMLVDRVAEVMDLASGDIEAAPSVGSDGAADYIQGVATVNGILHILVDLDKLFGGAEWLDQTL
jgi:purine-binding chemotaxis protein CheW